MDKKSKKAPVFYSNLIDVRKSKPPEIDLLGLWSSLTVLEDAIRNVKIKITEWIAQ